MNITIDEAYERYINIHRCSSAPRTVQYYIESLGRFIRFCDSYYMEFGKIIYIHEIESCCYMDYVQSLRQTGLRNVSVNTYCRSVRAWCSWLLTNGYINKSFIEGVRQLRDDSKQILPLTYPEVVYIDDYFNYDSVNGVRNYIIFHLMLDCGLRRQEVINLNCDDIKTNYISINNSKFNKSRIVPLPEQLHDAICQYTCLTGSGPLLIDRFGSRITIECIKRLFCNIKRNVSIKVNPHQLRHTFATSYIMGGGNLEFLRIILGHSSYNVTQRYLHVAAQCTIADIDIYRLDSCFFKNYNKKGY